MNKSQWIALAAGLTIIIACFMPWFKIPGGETISGVDTTGTRFGKPAFVHFIMGGLVLLFSFLPFLTGKRFNLLFAALNLAWAVKNFLVMGRCEAGDCPEKQTGIYLLLIASVVLMATVLFPKIDMQEYRDVN